MASVISRCFTTVLFLVLIHQACAQQMAYLSFDEEGKTAQGFIEHEDKIDYSETAQFADWKRDVIGSLQPGKGTVVLFIHAMWGSNSTFYKKNVKHFDKYYFGIESNVDYLIFLKWKSPSIDYLENRDKAPGIGTEMAVYLLPFLDTLRSRYPQKMFVMACHSMGNRVFMGLMSERHFVFDKVLLLAPDLTNEEFISVRGFEISTPRLVLFYNMYDYALNTAERIDGNDRLGCKPNLNEIDKMPHVVMLHRKNFLDYSTSAFRKFSHVYYMDSNSAIELIRSEFLE